MRLLCSWNDPSGIMKYLLGGNFMAKRNNIDAISGEALAGGKGVNIISFDKSKLKMIIS